MDIAPRIPTAWTEALRAVQAISPSAVIAGGCLRDLALGGEPKDVDIFVPVAETGGDLLVGFSASTIDWLETKCLHAAGYSTGMRSEVVTVQEFVVPGVSIPAQVIHLAVAPDEFVADTLARMDFDVCRIAWDGNHVVTAPGTSLAIGYSTATLVRCEDHTQARRSLKRAERFRQRYPDVHWDTRLATRVLEEAA